MTAPAAMVLRGDLWAWGAIWLCFGAGWIIVRRFWMLAAGAALMLIFAGSSLYWTAHNDSALDGTETKITGTVSSPLTYDGGRARFDLRTDQEEHIPVTWWFETEEEMQQSKRLLPGDRCQWAGELRKPGTAGNPGAFSYKTYLYWNKIHWLFTVENGQEIKCFNQSTGVVDTLQRLRAQQVQRMDNFFPEQAGGLAASLLFGERASMTGEVEEAYRSLGLIHVLVVSGMHVAIVSGAAFFLLKRIGMTKEHSYTIVLCLLPVYAVLTGGAPSVLRASIAAGIFIAWQKWGPPGQRLDPAVILLAVMGAMLFFNPGYLFHIGFQLSFLLSGHLLLCRKKMAAVGKWTNMAWVAGSSMLVSLPIVLWNFYQFSLWNVMINFLFTPVLLLLVLPFLFLNYLLSFFLASPPEVFSIMFSGIEWMHALFIYLSGMSWSTVLLGKPGAVFTIVYAAGCTVFVAAWNRGMRRQALYLSAAAMLAAVGWQWVAPYTDSRGTVTYLDVGQGDSTVIELPYRRGVVVVDGGGRVSFNEVEWEQQEKPFDPGEAVVAEYLKYRGIRHLDTVVATHGDADHVNGLKYLMEHVPTGELWYGRSTHYEPEELELLAEFDEHTDIRLVEGGETYQIGGTSFYVLHPRGEWKDKNDRSVVLYFELGEKRWLLTGDVSAEQEKRMIQNYPGLRADILKTGHHGSSTSTSRDFVEALEPEHAVISAGYCNRFGHPHPEPLEILERAGINIWRTDLQGAVQFTVFPREEPGIHTVRKEMLPACK
ncbi:DNA internalization-related competence protein ComEC/Rec2 [Marinococcus halophilus]|uniref:DNA internalization-related competence protein ComEC/Rec2 n=1 Tax=Marinococcus halophilus TaxID=1371 RepID=UPI0009A6CB8B|nr:DNA internalization-related competence protein ComEC/Rec2 [Marinococcus halophilus]